MSLIVGYGNYPLTTASHTALYSLEGSANNAWTPIAAAVASIASGCLFSSAFAAGVAYGIIATAISIPALLILHSLGIGKSPDERTTSEYSKFLEENKFDVCVTGPCQEELLFRGVVQTAFIELARLTFLNISESAITKIGVGCAALTFGSAHLTNPHEEKYIQALFSGFSAYFVLGPLAATYGVISSIGAHIVNNTIILGLTEIAKGCSFIQRPSLSLREIFLN